MQIEQLLSLAAFVVVMTGTPGPNNMMLMTSGANFGFRRSLPHILGITFGCQALLLAAALGLGRLMTAWPSAMAILRGAGALFVLYLAWLLLRARAPRGEPGEGGRPLSFLEAALFQWVNPKAWLMTVTAIASYGRPEAFVLSTFLISLLFFVLGLPLISLWNLGGASLRNWLRRESWLRWFNRAMAALLVASMVPVVAG